MMLKRPFLMLMAALVIIILMTAGAVFASPGAGGVTFSPSSGYRGIGQTLTATISADATGYVAGLITINGKPIDPFSFTDKGDTTYTVTYTVAAGDTNIPSGSTIPISVVLSTAGGNSTAPYTVPPPAANSPAIDAAVPVVTSVAFNITSGTLKIGDQLIATISADATGYTAGDIKINNKAVTGFADNHDNTYTVTYTVAAGDSDIAQAAEIPVSVALLDAAGNSNSPFTTAPLAANAPAVDANAPLVTGVTFSPSTGVLGIGGILTATITADAAGYTAGVITINGKAVTGFSDIGGGQYTVIYTVSVGDTSISDSSEIPISVVLTDTSLNSSAPFTTAPTFATAPAIDSLTPVIVPRPIITSVAFSPASGIVGIGGAVTATITADQAGYTFGSILINGKTATGFIDNGNKTYTVTYTVVEGDHDILDSLEIPVSVVLTDSSLISNFPFTTSPGFASAPAIDAHKPVITGITFSPTTGVLGAGETLTAIITADAAGYAAGTITINGKAIDPLSFTDNLNNTYTVKYTVAAGDNDILQTLEIPVSIVLVDTGGNSSLTFTTAPLAVNAPSIAILPIVSNVTYSPTSGTLKIGNSLTATIFADASGYTAGAITINGKAVTGFTDNHNNTYTVTYTVASGDTDVAQTSQIPLSAVLTDAAGNSNDPYTTKPSAISSPAIDANSPIITSITFSPSAGIIGIGSSLIATITADAAGYAAGTITINGKAVTGFTDNHDNTYTVTYTVASGDTDIAQTSQIPVSVVLTDAAGNSNAPFTTAPAFANAPAIDTNKPVILGVTFDKTTGIIGIGGILTATITADASGYNAGAITINSKAVTGFTDNHDNTYSVKYVVAAGDLDIAQTSPIPISVVLTDAVLNSNIPFTTAPLAVNAPAIDAHSPVITSVTFSPASGILGIGGILTATITADTTGYTPGTITINNKTVSGFTEIGGGIYSVIYTVTAGDADVADTLQVPISVVLVDGALNTNAPFTTAPLAVNAPAIDANRPVISNVTFNPPSGILGVGGILTATITADAAGYAAGAITINGKGITGFADVGGGVYTVYYTVTPTDANIAQSSVIAISVVLTDTASNSNAPYTTAPTFANTPAINAHPPVISGVTFSPSSGILGLGGVLTATITADAVGYTAGAITINGKTATGFTDNLNNTYTVTYTVISGDTDVAQTAEIPVSIVLLDATLTGNTPFTTAPLAANSPAIDANRPVISGITFNPASGVVRAGQALKMIITADATGYSLSAISINGKIMTAFVDNNDKTYTVTYNVAAGDTNIRQDAQIPISVVLNDTAGNSNSVYTSSPSATVSPAINGSLADTVSAVTGLTIVGPAAVATDLFGNIYIADTSRNQIVMVDSLDNTVLVAGTGTAGFVPFTTSTTLADTTLQFNAPAGITTDIYGNVYVADSGNHRVHMIIADPVTKLISSASRIVTVAGSGTKGFAGDGAIATVPLVRLNNPTAVAVDNTGTVDSKGKLLTTGNLYIADNGNYLIRKVLPVKASTNTTTLITTFTSGLISTIAGDGNATRLTAYGVALSPNLGDLYIADAGNNRILKIAATKGVIDGKTAPVSVVGNGVAGFAGDSGPAILAQLNQPKGVATDGVDLYIADTENNSVRRVSLATGIISTRLGSTLLSAAIDAPVGFARPASVAVDAVGTVIVEDAGNSVIQKIVASNSGITTASPPGGVYKTIAPVTLTSSTGAIITYSINGGAQQTYTKAIPISGPATTILTFTSTDSAGHAEVMNTATYIFDTTGPVATAEPLGNSFSKPQSVTLTSEQNAVIYYTTSGTAPTTSSTKYTTPLTINKTITLMYFAVDTVGNSGTTETQVYTIDVVAPITTASVLSGTYASIQSVALTSDDPKAAIHYTTDGSIPTAASPKYTTPVLINNSTVLSYFAIDIAGNKELVKTQEYTIIILTTTASPKGGVFNSPQTVVLSANGAGTIYYTIDGTVPSTTSKTTKKYSSTAPILLQDAKTTIQFFAVDTKGVIEKVKVEIYTVDSTPATTVAVCGTTANKITLTATDAVDLLPKIMYSTSNSVNHSGTAFAYYTSPVVFSNNTIVKFFAVDAAGNIEPIKTAYCAVVAAPLDTNPALYLETLADGSTTSSLSLYVSGNVAPFTATTLDINGTVITTSTVDGSFSHVNTLVAGVNSITTTATNGILSSVDTRTINYLAPGTTPTTITIGKSIGVIGHSVRVPISLASGYQVAAVSIDIAYDPTTSNLSNPAVTIAKTAAALGKSIQGGTTTNSLGVKVYRIVINDLNKLNTPLPDGEIANLSFTVISSAVTGIEALAIDSNSATDLNANSLILSPGTDGTVTIVAKPGDTFALGVNNPSTLKGVQDALYMLLDPVTYPVSGSVDLNADGIVQIYELQQVINSFIGL